MTTRDELVVALAGRYALGNRADRGRMLDEFAALTGHHRKHAMRLLVPESQVNAVHAQNVGSMIRQRARR